MKNITKISVILIVCLLTLGQSTFAQPVAESELFNSQTYLQSSSHSAKININAEVLTPESGKYEINEDTPMHETLPVLSDMLNQNVEARADASFESLRRNSIFSVESTLVSRFLGFVSSRRSA